MKRGMFVLLLAVMLFAQGCATMSAGEQSTMRELEDVGAPCAEVANPAAAGLLNILPGVGDLYLANGKGANSGSWGAFVLDLLLWPYSPLWAVPQGVITAQTVNDKECAGHYRDTAMGRAELKKLQARREGEVAELKEQEPAI